MTVVSFLTEDMWTNPAYNDLLTLIRSQLLPRRETIPRPRIIHAPEKTRKWKFDG